MITEAGAFAAGHCVVGAGSAVGRSSDFADIVSLGSHLPHWDRQHRQLSFDGCVVKRFRVPANNQEAVFSAFQQAGWPPSINDPLPYLPGQRKRAKERLHATIRCLNANQENRLLRFSGDGTGEAVIWEPLVQRAANPSTLRFHRAA